MDQPALLYFCDFPPSNARGGTVLMSRLLSTYPQDKLTILISSYFDQVSPSEGRLPCHHLVFPTTNETGRWGIGRIKSLIDWLLIPILVAYAMWAIKARGSKAIVTIAHGHFFVAAALTSWIAAVPLIIIVHDDWVTQMRRTAILLKYFCGPLFRIVANRASQVYTVTPYMQEMLKEKYGVTSDVQMPAAESYLPEHVSPALNEGSDGQCLRIIYAGTGTLATEDSLNMLMRLVMGDMLSRYSINSWELHLYIMATQEQIKALGWEHPRVKFHGWVTQDELRRVLSTVDILFLPFSFHEEQRFATAQAFPTKTSDYLASGTPILILAPPYSSVVRYARQFGFAEIVDEASEEKLAQGIVNIWKSPDRRRLLHKNAQKAFMQNHYINKQRSDFQKVIARLVGEKSGRVVSDIIADS